MIFKDNMHLGPANELINWNWNQTQDPKFESKFWFSGTPQPPRLSKRMELGVVLAYRQQAQTRICTILEPGGAKVHKISSSKGLANSNLVSRPLGAMILDNGSTESEEWAENKRLVS